MKRLLTVNSKKIYLIIICLLCVLMVCACSNQASENTASEEEVQSDGGLSGEEEKEVSTEDIGNNELINKIIDLSGCFNDKNGCAVFFNANANQYLIYNEEMCELEISPYSTFKIISTLIGLENGVIENETSTMNYNNTQYPISEWNENLTLEEAFRTSCIWYFRQIIDTVGENEVKKELENLQYGNCDVSEWQGSNANSLEDLNGFWLDSSLKISPYEQVQVLGKIFEGESRYSENSVNILKNIMLVNDTGDLKIYGKTGAGSNGKAWFVGFSESEEEEQKIYFAIYLNDEEQQASISGNTAKDIALEIMNSKLIQW